MATVFRFILEGTPNVIRLDLNSSSGWQMQKRFDIGEADLEETWLTQTPYDGGTLASSRRPVTTMRLRLRLNKQVSWAATKAAFDALATELDRKENVIEFIPDGASSRYLIDTFRSPIPSLFRGQELQTVATRLEDHDLALLVRRHPTLRGAGSYI